MAPQNSLYINFCLNSSKERSRQETLRPSVGPEEITSRPQIFKKWNYGQRCASFSFNVKKKNPEVAVNPHFTRWNTTWKGKPLCCIEQGADFCEHWNSNTIQNMKTNIVHSKVHSSGCKDNEPAETQNVSQVKQFFFSTEI